MWLIIMYNATICRVLSSYVCSITPETAKVGSSYSHIRGPGISCWFSHRSNCSCWSFDAAVLLINPNIYTNLWEHQVCLCTMLSCINQNTGSHQTWNSLFSQKISILTPRYVSTVNYDILMYRQVSNIRHTLEGNKIVDHSDVVGASPVGAAPTTSSFST